MKASTKAMMNLHLEESHDMQRISLGINYLERRIYTLWMVFVLAAGIFATSLIVIFFEESKTQLYLGVGWMGITLAIMLKLLLEIKEKVSEKNKFEMELCLLKL